KAGMQIGDVVLKLDGIPLTGQARLFDAMFEKKPGDKMTVAYQRDGKPLEVAVTLAVDTGGGFGKGKGGKGGGDQNQSWDSRNLNTWKKDLYRLAVIGIEYPDVKHNAKITAKDWED